MSYTMDIKTMQEIYRKSEAHMEDIVWLSYNKNVLDQTDFSALVYFIASAILMEEITKNCQESNTQQPHLEYHYLEKKNLRKQKIR